MEDPVKDIPDVIHSLTQTPPSVQHFTIKKYFTSTASFTHPFCRTGSFYINDLINSKNAIWGIYRWYKILSPQIEIQVNSVAFDQDALLLYAHISQKVRIWFIPFYCAHVSLVTVLQLVQDKQTSKYLIKSQDDRYQVNEYIRFFWFGGSFLVGVWQIFTALFCSIGAVLTLPQTWVEEHWFPDGWRGIAG
ncbi:hypothetical protein E2P81_ATG11319 [Venturia nashicola]|uniref:SigF-like NTF2-like domain-containing protein n=1 Tax=Venturia nashicola TaxID=86259 RepID=A0A4Z1P0W8_9PEZI|nr:hypothetical protein E6O75_ATG11007 [Venturia nashicola]TLD35200.1 hypothetical protein E2P81_ATG11319 [Venturia nashicola]